MLAPLLRLWPWREPLNEVEAWFQTRIHAAKEFGHSRRALGDDWYFRKMGSWDIENFDALIEMKSNPVLSGYREDPRTGQPDGFRAPSRDLPEAEQRRQFASEYERYYAQRLKWLKRTSRRLRRGR